MMNLIKLKSRGQEKNYLEKLSRPNNLESKTYVLKVSTSFRYGELGEDKKFIDPLGGPMIIVGSYLEEAKSVVKSIDFVKGCGYTITFE